MQFSLKEHSADFLLLTTSIIWGFAFVGIKFSLNEISPENLTILRFFIASFGFLIFLIFAYFKDKNSLKIEKRDEKEIEYNSDKVHEKNAIDKSSQKKFERNTIENPNKLQKQKSEYKLQSSDLLPIIALGFLGTVCYHLALNFGEQYTTAGISSLIVSSAPIFTAILSFAILKEKINSKNAIGIVIAFIGVAIVMFFGSSEKFEMKSLLAMTILISPIAWAFYTVISKPLLEKYTAIVLTTYTTLFGTLMLLPLLKMSFFEQVFNLSLMTWVAILFLGIASTFFAAIIWYLALSKKSAVSTSVYIYLIPFFGVLGGVVLLQEKITIALIVGGCLIIFGIVLNNLKQK